jgi:hypothetical protein
MQQLVDMQTCLQQQLRDEVLLIIHSLVGAAKKMKNQYLTKKSENFETQIAKRLFG